MGGVGWWTLGSCWFGVGALLNTGSPRIRLHTARGLLPQGRRSIPHPLNPLASPVMQVHPLCATCVALLKRTLAYKSALPVLFGEGGRPVRADLARGECGRRMPCGHGCAICQCCGSTVGSTIGSPRPQHRPAAAGLAAGRGAGGLAAEAQMLDRMAAAVGHTLDGLLSGKCCTACSRACSLDNQPQAALNIPSNCPHMQPACVRHECACLPLQLWTPRHGPPTSSAPWPPCTR